MEEVRRIYKEYTKISFGVTSKWNEIDHNTQMLITFHEGKLTGLLDVCYMMDDVAESIIDIVKKEFEFYKVLAGVEG